MLPEFDKPGVIVMDPPYGYSHASSHGASWQNTNIANDHDTSLRDYIIEWAVDTPFACFGHWKVTKPEGLKGVLVWDKGPAFGMGDLNFPWKPSWEEIYIKGDGWHGKRTEGVERGHIVVSWESKGRRHPHAKPVSLCAAIVAKAPPGVVIDPVAGTGPVGQACKDLGRKCIMIELELKYVKIAAERLRQDVLPLHD